MRRQRLNRLSPYERDELNRKLKDDIDAELVRPRRNEFSSSIVFVRRADGYLHLCIYYRGLKGVTRNDAYTLLCVDGTLEKLKGEIFTLVWIWRLGFGKFELQMKMFTRQYFKILID
jgi:hypothetical protein